MVHDDSDHFLMRKPENSPEKIPQRRTISGLGIRLKRDPKYNLQCIRLNIHRENIQSCKLGRRAFCPLILFQTSALFSSRELLQSRHQLKFLLIQVSF